LKEVLEALGASHAAPVAGGCIHRCYRAIIGGAERFIKLNDARFADAFAAEADGLEALRAAGVRAPQPYQHGARGDYAFLVLEFVELRTSGDWAALGRLLAGTHRHTGPRFGWTRDNTIGSTPQRNGWCDDWMTFFGERRLRPQLALAARNGFHFEVGEGLEILRGHRPQPSLLHGDLWSGNAAFTPDGAPVLFDPAVYYGDREADLAMTDLFGGFPREFYAAYQEAYPLEAGYALRKRLYNLYHLLNHLNLFGGGYAAQVRSTLRLLLDRL
jgi:protein-ribulosamine 3-kinase